MIRNPILRGFNPDPSICRVGDDYYIATSTFEWYPGVQLHHSRDLVKWRLVGRALDRKSQLDMRGNPDSGGIWAPCLSYADGLFWLVYTDVKRLDGAFKDTHNYIVTAPSVEGPWSDPVYVNSSGFDPSLFHDDDGKKWFLNMLWNHVSSGVGGQPKHPSFAGILLQEYDPAAGRLIGEAVNIFEGSPLGLVEGPHLFKRDGWYYLTTAEGGTGYGHAVTMARSRNIAGPYEMHPNVHLITSKDAPEAVLQRAGHGQLVVTPAGEIYHTHLCSRPLPGTRRSPLGRETAIQKCVWKDDGWLYLEHGGQVPAVEVPAPRGAAEPKPLPRIERYDFDEAKLPLDFQWLRIPEWQRLFSLEARAGHLRLYGRESIGSWFEQALVARRQDAFDFRAETVVEFTPTSFQQAAGIVHYYNRHKFHFLAITHDARLSGRVLTVMSCPGDWPDGRLTFPMAEPVRLPGDGPVGLAAEVRGAELAFHFAAVDGEWQQAGGVLDASVISDEGGRGEHGSFTGAFIGMAAFDTSGRGAHADFDWFTYERLAPGAA
ncbi:MULTISPECIES: glycoside hydrolase family 43 protein [unclassified Aminobacter]|uniref:glycoside hydrolase family 43 protein n=1 Tax=unclassified Aminobacter TaxID=2644704 RepID=UPI00046680AA|nr:MULTISPECIES: glycoside hydrolase family 43 protein [unclassified Aminobacter]TWG65984.1 xylan 1,4-beta-xylosidase [Aminobacter sp. J44]TWH27295.1 xylan 1,4-beta-xylosidase [Aminobacter sp. J15]